MIERGLRGAAIAVAVLAMLDPSVTVPDRVRPRVAVVVQGGPSMELPAAAEFAATRRSEGERIRRTLRRDLRASLEIVDGMDDSASAVVIIGDRYPEDPVAEDVRVSTVTVKAALSPNVALVRAWTPRAIPPATSIRINARVDAAGVAGATSVLTVRASGTEVGRSTHVWSADHESWRAAIDAVPVGEAPFTFELDVAPLTVERTDADNRAVVRVDEAPRMRVLVFEARPSWASAFVRRSLEGDPRFDVSAVGLAAPGVAVRTGVRPELGDDRAFDAVVVGGIDRLSKTHVAMLDRFMRERGGAVAMLPDAPPSAAARDLIAAEVREVLLERAAMLDTGALPRLDASEMFEAAADLPLGSVVLARSASSGRPVVWTTARGDGRLLVSGAMDAWRYRAEGQVAFDRFWRAAISGLALNARPPLELTLTPSRVSPGDPVRATVTVRSLERRELGDRLAIAARVGESPLRLWPDARAGVFTGSFVATADGVPISASIGDPRSAVSTRMTIDPHPRESPGAPLALLATTRGGIDVVPADLAKLERHLIDTLPPRSASVVRHPMRSAWSFVALAFCVSGEWWLRRRRGAR